MQSRELVESKILLLATGPKVEYSGVPERSQLLLGVCAVEGGGANERID